MHQCSGYNICFYMVDFNKTVQPKMLFMSEKRFVFTFLFFQPFFNIENNSFRES